MTGSLFSPGNGIGLSEREISRGYLVGDQTMLLMIQTMLNRLDSCSCAFGIVLDGLREFEVVRLQRHLHETFQAFNPKQNAFDLPFAELPSKGMSSFLEPTSASDLTLKLQQRNLKLIKKSVLHNKCSDRCEPCLTGELWQ